MSVLPVVFGLAFAAGMVIDLLLVARCVRRRYREKIRAELESLDAMVGALTIASAKNGPTDEERATIVGVREYIANARKRWEL